MLIFGWLAILHLLKRMLANGFPVIIESGMRLDQSYRVNDDRWGGHYLLVTGYDDDAGLFTVQDSWYSANRLLTYDELDENWKAFNRAYLLVFLPDQSEQIRELVGENWNEETNRVSALNIALDETEADPDDAFAWFNVGTNLLYFERYAEAAQAYDTAIRLGIPQRMLRHQFGPFIAYFKTSRNDDLKALAEYALKITPTSEENRLWYGWALFREGDRAAAIDEFNKALHVNPNYIDARYALNYCGRKYPMTNRILITCLIILVCACLLIGIIAIAGVVVYTWDKNNPQATITLAPTALLYPESTDCPPDSCLATHIGCGRTNFRAAKGYLQNHGWDTG